MIDTVTLPYGAAPKDAYEALDAWVNQREGPLRFQYQGDPWCQGTYEWTASLWWGRVRTDALSLSWTMCCLETAQRLGRSRAQAYDGTLIREFGLPRTFTATFYEGWIEHPSRFVRSFGDLFV